MTASSVTLAAICIAITLFSLTVAALAVRMARKEIAHSRAMAERNNSLFRLNRALIASKVAWATTPNTGRNLGPDTQVFIPDDGLDV